MPIIARKTIMNPGVYLIQISAIHSDPDRIKITGKRKDGRFIYFFLDKPVKGIHANVIRKRILRKFFIDAGADFHYTSIDDVPQFIIGKWVNVVLREEEYISFEENGKPFVNTSVCFWYSAPEDEKLHINKNQLYKPLSDSEQHKFFNLFDKWNSQELSPKN